MTDQKTKIDSFGDVFLDDSPERLQALVKQFAGSIQTNLANNILLAHLIKNIQNLNRSTTILSGIMIFLIIGQVILFVIDAFFR